MITPIHEDAQLLVLDKPAGLLAVPDLREVMGRRELYRRFARIGDDITEVAERVWYAAVKEA